MKLSKKAEDAMLAEINAELMRRIETHPAGGTDYFHSVDPQRPPITLRQRYNPFYKHPHANQFVRQLGVWKCHGKIMLSIQQIVPEVWAKFQERVMNDLNPWWESKFSDSLLSSRFGIKREDTLWLYYRFQKFVSAEAKRQARPKPAEIEDLITFSDTEKDSKSADKHRHDDDGSENDDNSDDEIAPPIGADDPNYLAMYPPRPPVHVRGGRTSRPYDRERLERMAKYPRTVRRRISAPALRQPARPPALEYHGSNSVNGNRADAYGADGNVNFDLDYFKNRGARRREQRERAAARMDREELLDLSVATDSYPGTDTRDGTPDTLQTSVSTYMPGIQPGGISNELSNEGFASSWLDSLCILLCGCIWNNHDSNHPPTPMESDHPVLSALLEFVGDWASGSSADALMTSKMRAWNAVLTYNGLHGNVQKYVAQRDPAEILTSMGPALRLLTGGQYTSVEECQCGSRQILSTQRETHYVTVNPKNPATKTMQDAAMRFFFHDISGRQRLSACGKPNCLVRYEKKEVAIAPDLLIFDFQRSSMMSWDYSTAQTPVSILLRVPNAQPASTSDELPTAWRFEEYGWLGTICFDQATGRWVLYWRSSNLANVLYFDSGNGPDLMERSVKDPQFAVLENHLHQTGLVVLGNKKNKNAFATVKELAIRCWSSDVESIHVDVANGSDGHAEADDEASEVR